MPRSSTVRAPLSLATRAGSLSQLERALLLGAILCGALLFGGLQARPAGAVVKLTNPDMVRDLSGWTLSSGGSWSHAPGTGIFGALGAAEVSANGSGMLTMVQCAAVGDRAPGGSVTGLFWARTVNHTSDVSLEVELFSGANCTGSSVELGTNLNDDPPMDQWKLGSVVLEIPGGGATSARFTMKVAATAGGQITRFAHAFLGENLLRNGHFDDDVLDWAVNRGPWDHLTSDGVSDPTGVARATNEDAWTVMSTCDSLASSPFGPTAFSDLYFVGAAIKPLDAGEQQRLLLEWYEEPNCTVLLDSVTFFSAATPPVDEWSTLGGFRALPTGAQSYVLRIGTNSNDDFPAQADSRILWDNIYLTPSNRIFADFFESGGLAAWTSSVGN